MKAIKFDDVLIGEAFSFHDGDQPIDVKINVQRGQSLPLWNYVGTDAPFVHGLVAAEEIVWVANK